MDIMTPEQIEDQINALKEVQAKAIEQRERDRNVKAIIDVTTALEARPVEQVLAMVETFLNQIGARFTITTRSGVKMKSSTKHVAGERRSRAITGYERGEVQDYIINRIRDMKPGDNLTLTAEKYPLDVLSVRVGHAAMKLWGPKSYTSNRTTTGVMVHRRTAAEYAKAVSENKKPDLHLATVTTK